MSATTTGYLVYEMEKKSHPTQALTPTQAKTLEKSHLMPGGGIAQDGGGGRAPALPREISKEATGEPDLPASGCSCNSTHRVMFGQFQKC
ncbi:MAG: hypothetical protein Q8L48_41945 [Archangium sp.]|nr:hypothetical protein [Archangium sp.]